MREGGQLRIANKKKGERVVKGLLKKRTRFQHDAEIPEIPGAGVRLEKLEKRIEKLESEVAVMRPTYEELQAWKMEQERKGGAS